MGLMRLMDNMTACPTCGGLGEIYVGRIKGKHKYRMCPKCKGLGEHVKKVVGK